MTEDAPFLRTLLANPGDLVSRLVYADWLEDRADPRAEYLRLFARAAELSHEDTSRPELRRRMLELQAGLPSWWVAIAGGLRVTSTDEPGIGPHIEQAARILGRAVQYTDESGYTVTIAAAATSGLTGAVAYLEERSLWQGEYHDIHYHLYLRDTAGRIVVWEPHTYNPFFGCDPRFLEWYGDVVLFIYREKHDTYITRFGFDVPGEDHKAEDYWILDDREFSFIGYSQKEVSRLSVPNLELLPALTLTDAANRELLPTTWSWLLKG